MAELYNETASENIARSGDVVFHKPL